MPENKIVMTFKNSANKNTDMTISDTRPDVTDAEAVAAMDTILAANIFRPGGFDLVSKVDCKRVQITETDCFDAV